MGMTATTVRRPRSTSTELGQAEWPMKPCRELCVKIQDGTHFSPKLGGDDFLYVTSKSIRFGFLDLDSAERISTAEHRKIFARCDTRFGDLLLTKDGANTGNAALNTLTEEISLLSSVAFLRFDPSLHDARFFLQYVLSHRGQQRLQELMSGNAITRLTLQKIRNFTMPSPPLGEQRAIAAALSDVDGLIAALERLIAKKRAIKQAAMQQLLTGKTRLPGFAGDWFPTSLRNLGRTYGGLTGKAGEDFGHGDAQYVPFLNIMNNVVLDPTYLEAVNVAPTERQNEVMQGDLFFNGSSETPEEVGMCAVLLEPLKRVFVNSFCFGFRLFPGAAVDGLYLAYYLRSAEGRRLVYSLAQGATRHNLSKTALLALKFPLPALDEQRAISAVLSEMDSAIEAAARRRDKAKAIKQGMMQALLTGRVRLPVTAAAGGQA